MTPTQITAAMINAALKEWWRDRLTCNPTCGWECMRRTLAAALAAAPVAEQAAEIERLRAALGVDHG